MLSGDGGHHHHHHHIAPSKTAFIARYLPPHFFKQQERVPIAPVKQVLASFGFELVCCALSFALMAYYFSTQSTQAVVVSPTVLDGYNCSVLNPKKGVVYYSADSSENGQFASPFMRKDECVSLLKSSQVCEAGVRQDHLSVLGVVNPNNSIFYQNPSYYTFTPSEKQGLTTQLTAFYGASVSFPKPVVEKQFSGSSTTFNVYNFAKNVAADAFKRYTGVSVPNLLTDLSKQKLYGSVTSTTCTATLTTSSNELSDVGHPTSCMSAISVGDSVYGDGIPTGTVVTAVGTPSTSDGLAYAWKVWISNPITACTYCSGVALTFYPQTTDFDLSTSTPSESTTSEKISTMKDALGLENYVVADIGVFNGVYYGILSQYKFSAPSGVAVYDSGLNSQVFVADYGDRSMFMVGDAGLPANVVAVSSNANRASLQGVAVGPTTATVGAVGVADLYYTDTAGVAGARYLAGGYTSGIGSLSNVGTFSAGSGSKGLAVDVMTGDLYVVLYESSDNKVVKITRSGATYSTSTDFITVLNHPSGVSVYGTGSNLVLYVSDTDSHVIKKYVVVSALGSFSKNVGVSAIPAFSYPTGLAVDSTGSYVYVADTGNNLIRKITLSTDFVESLAVNADPPFSGPTGVAVDTNGFVYVADKGNNMVRKIDPATGQLTTRVGRIYNEASGALFSFDLSVSPSTYGLTSAGLTNSIQWVNSGSEVLSRPSGSLDTISPIDTIDGGCRSLEAFKKTYGSTTETLRCFLCRCMPSTPTAFCTSSFSITGIPTCALASTPRAYSCSTRPPRHQSRTLK